MRRCSGSSTKNLNLIDDVQLIGKERIFATGFYWKRSASFLCCPLCLLSLFFKFRVSIKKNWAENNCFNPSWCRKSAVGNFSLFFCWRALCKCVCFASLYVSSNKRKCLSACLMQSAVSVWFIWLTCPVWNALWNAISRGFELYTNSSTKKKTAFFFMSI